MVTAVAEFIQAYYGTVFVTVTTLGGLIWLLYGLELKEPNSADFEKLRNRVAVQSGCDALYMRNLADLLNWSDHFYEGGFRERRPNPWSFNAYGMSLILALVYPITGAVISWGFTGQAGNLGQALGLTQTSNVMLHIVTLIWVIIILALFAIATSELIKFGNHWKIVYLAILIVSIATFGNDVVEALTGEKPPTIVFASTFVVVLVASSAIPFRVALVGAVSGVIALALGAAYSISGTLPGAFGGAIVTAVAVVGVTRKYPYFVFVVSIVYLAASFVLIWVFPEIVGDQKSMGLMIGLLLLPLVNAPFDFFSTGLTRYLLRKSYAADGWQKKSLLSLVDLVVALFTMVLLGLALVVVLELLNTAASATVVDVAELLASIKANPTAIGNWWIYAALFSTLLPTLIHVVCWALSFIRFTLPRGYRDWMVAQFDDCFADGPMTKFKVQASLALQLWLAIAFTVLALVGFIALIVGLLHGGKYYLEILMYVQQVVNGWF